MLGASASAPVGRLARWGRVLFALEARPPYLRLAVRGTLGLMVPLLLGQALAWPSLNVVAFAAFLLAFGDLSEDRGWLMRLATGSLFGGLAVATGALIGGHPVSAAIGMLAWGVAFGLVGAYGDGAAAMSLPIAWMFLALGLAAPVHTLAESARVGGLVVAGGAWAAALAWAIRAIGPSGPLLEQTARSFTILADYLEHALARDVGAAPQAPATADGYGPSRETRVRAAIAEARILAVEARRREGGASRVGQRLVVLIELADQAFLLGCVLGETRARRAGASSPPADTAADDADAATCRTLLTTGAREVARLLTKHEAAPRIEEDLRRLGEAVTAPVGPRAGDALAAAAPDKDRSEIRGRLAEALAQAVQLAAGRPAPMPALLDPEAPPDAGRRPLNQLLAPLRSSLDRHSVVGRHALRYGLVTAIAVAIDKSLAAPFAYWIPLTVTVVLKPYAGSTLTRAGQRLASTIAGVAVGVLVLQIVAAPIAKVAVSAAAFFGTIAVLPLNYGVAIFFLSVGIVPLEAMLGGETSWQIGLLRVAYTCVGGALALAGGYFLWPSFERQSLPTAIAATVSSMAVYADRVLAVRAGGTPLPALLETAHRHAGLDTTKLQAVFQRVVAEPGENHERLEASLLAVVTLQRLLVTFNALRELGPAVGAGQPEWARFRALVHHALADLPAALDARSQPEAMTDLVSEAREISARLTAHAARYDGLLAQEVERAAWQLSGLRTAIGRLAAARP